jgi:hypothetical protein
MHEGNERGSYPQSAAAFSEREICKRNPEPASLSPQPGRNGDGDVPIAAHFLNRDSVLLPFFK